MNRLVLLILLFLSASGCFAQGFINYVATAGGGGGADPNVGLISYWKMDNASGNLTDSKDGNAGVPAGTGTIVTYNVAGKINTAIDMNEEGSVSSRLDMADPINLQLTSSGSISLWYKPIAADLTSAPGLVSKMNWNTDRNGYGVFVISAHPAFEIANASAANLLTLTAITMVAGTFYHIVFTWSGSTITGYVNGSLVSSMAQTVNATSAGINFTIARAWNGTDYANFGSGGVFDEVAIWDHAISATEVSIVNNSNAGLTCCPFILPSN